MVVKIIEYIENQKVETLEECDKIKVFKDDRTIHLIKGQEDEVKAYTFQNKARIFVMEKGSTIDRIDF